MAVIRKIISKADVGLGNVDNTSDANKPVPAAVTTALAGKAALSHTHNKSEVGLGNVDDTADVNKPVSTLQAAAIAGASLLSGSGAPSNTLGAAKQFYVDTASARLYGPKASTWPSKYFDLTAAILPVTTSAPVNTAAPTIAGVYQSGQTVTATTGVWTGAPTPTYAYQWLRGPSSSAPVDPAAPPVVLDPTTLTAISGATSATYVLQAADIGFVIYVRVTATNSEGITVAYSLKTAAIASPPSLIPSNTALPQITGVTQIGATLTASSGSWLNSPTAYAYQWRRNGAPISGATAQTYVLASADQGTAITVAVIATNASGSSVAAISNPTNSIAVVTDATTAPILVSPPVITGPGVETTTLTSFQASWIETLTQPSNTALPTISGATAQGMTLTASPGTWDANPAPTFAYQWTRDTTPISSATASTYVLVSGDVGHRIAITVVATNSAGSSIASSEPTGLVTGAVSTPTNTSAPTITGTPTEGQTLSVGGSGAAVIDPTNLAGTANLTFSEEWDTLSLYNGTTGRWATGYHWYPPQGGSLNDEQQWYVTNTYAPTSAVVPWTVSNGVLSITANPTPSDLISQVGNYAYTSGMLTTYRSFTQQEGYFVARLKLPKGQGFWPAFWMIPADGSWPPELDIMENLGRDITHYYATTHWSSANQQLGQYVATPDLSVGFHDFGMRWDATSITYFFDGVQVAQHAAQPDMSKPFYMILNLALGGQWGGNIDSTTPFPATLQCDYVRAYAAKGATPGSWSNNPTSYSYQWKRGGTNISGATGPNYVLSSADVGSAITVAVTATNAAGSATATSAATANVAALAVTSGDGTVWNAADFTGADPTTLSSDKRTLFNRSNTYTDGGSRTEKRITGKRYFEVLIGARTNNLTIGLSDPATSTVYDAPGQNANSVGWVSYGSVQTAWSSINTNGDGVPFPPNGGVARFCVDEPNRLMWVAADDNLWNAHSDANPATGVGGMPIPGTFQLYIAAKFEGGARTDSITLNTTSAQFVKSAPSGFAAIV